MGTGKTLEEAIEIIRLEEIIRSRSTKKRGGRIRRHRKTKKQF